MTQDALNRLKDRAFNAKHDGRCAACGKDFEAGEMIVMIDSQTVEANDECLTIASDE